MSTFVPTDRPILFTPENAQKVHEGTKTQTRRIVKPQPSRVDAHGSWYAMPSGGESLNCYDCPYGTVGDRLWVREAWCCGRPALPTGRGIIPHYGPMSTVNDSLTVRYKGDWLTGDAPKWRPSIYMPEWACRTWLKLTAVRVERLHDISEEDAKAEGAYGYPAYETYRMGFRGLWESNKIHKPGSWDLNPWVWVLSFNRLKLAKESLDRVCNPLT